MLATSIIEKKRDGGELSDAEIQRIVDGITDQSLPDYQIAAWAMAVLFRGMTERETAKLTSSMLESGVRLSRNGQRPRVDKHSTGGLGDKTSLILAPLLACFDLDVPMLSGRGLGITGGTLDKLESYSGYRCDLSLTEIDRQLDRLGCVITGTTGDVAPADRRLYALRDVTGTVPSIPLITASIMSKKLAESLDALVLDVKWGSGAFMQALEQAQQLQQSLVATGRAVGLATTSLLTDMNQPLGQMVGNACEANESFQVLCGHGPADVRELTLELAVAILLQTERCSDALAARKSLQAALQDGRAAHRYQAMIEAQGGRFTERLPLAASHQLLANESGWLAKFDGRQLGFAVIELGGGRRQKQDQVNHRVGLELLLKIGQPVEKGQPLMRVFSDRSPVPQTIIERLASAVTIADHPISPPDLIVQPM
jgi:pyrimidine-nucleoside phosphorylase